MTTEKDYYPEGAYDDPDAPWNQSDPATHEAEVTVSMTLSKTVKILLEDNYDYSDSDLKDEVMAQLYLPCDAGRLLKDIVRREGVPNKYTMIDDLSDWEIDDFEVIPN